MLQKHFNSPFGKLYVAADEDGISSISFRPIARVSGKEARPTTAEIQALSTFERSLKRYVAGDLSAFNKLKVNPRGTAFQKKVWRALTRIKPGTVSSYGEIARKVGKPLAARAVGTACGKNPVCVVVPCHRVVTGQKTLGGFSGGLAKKKGLLRHEGISLPD